MLNCIFPYHLPVLSFSNKLLLSTYSQHRRLSLFFTTSVSASSTRLMTAAKDFNTNSLAKIFQFGISQPDLQLR